MNYIQRLQAVLDSGDNTFEYDDVKRLVSLYLELTKKLDAAQQDAERYRWLRAKGALQRAAHIAVLTRNGGYVGEEEVVDALIDAARRKG